MIYFVVAVLILMASYGIATRFGINGRGWLFVTLASGLAACCMMTPQAQALLAVVWHVLTTGRLPA